MLGSQLAMDGGQTRTWDGGAGDDNWNNNVNWSNNTLPSANNDTASFAGNFGTGTTAITLGGNQNTGTLTISTATDFSISNDTLTLATGDITRSVTSGTTTINSGILLGNDGAWNIAGSAANGVLTINGIIDDGAGTFDLDKTGNGTLILNNANTFGGNLIVNAGIVVLGDNAAAGAGILDLSGGTLQAAGAARTLANTVSITANSTIGGALDLTFNGSVSEDNSRTLSVTNTGITTFSGSTLTLAPNNATDSLTFDIDGTSGGVVVSSVVQNGTGSGADGLIKTGTGSLTLNNNNTFTGNLTLDQGTLILGHNSAAGAGTLDLSGGTIEGAGGTRTISNNLAITGNNTFGGDDLIFTDSFDQGGGRTYTVNNTTEFSGSLNGGDNLTKAGTGTLILSGNNSIGSAIDTVTVSAGTLRAANSGALGGTGFGTVIDNGATLELSGGIAIGAEALSLRGAGVGGAGALRNISGDNSWAGNITLTDNTQVHRINSDAGLLTISGGITETGNANNKDLTFGGAGNITVTGAITGSNGDMRLFKDGGGNLTLTNIANAYDGLTTISGGTLFANNASGSATGTGAISVTSGGTLGGSGTLAPTGANGISVSGVLAPGGALNTIGNLTLNMGGTTGTVAMNSGASFEFQLGLPGGSISSVGTSDLLSLASASASDFAFNGNNVNFLSSGALGFYKLFDTSSDNANTWTGLAFDSTTGVVSAGLTYSNLASGLSGNFLVGTAGNGGTTGDIYFQVVPEPRAALLGGLGVLLLLRRRRNA
jgi:autotransporter-associated beta strand protein